MKNLVIHFEDPTTTFLKNIYKDIPHTLINTGDRNEVLDAMPFHERYIMCGHGSPTGLFGFNYNTIWHGAVPYLKYNEHIYIWCNADKFVEFHNLHGLYSGMFISEVGEAMLYNIYATEEEINHSNYLFADILGDCLKKGYSLKECHDTLHKEYRGKSPVIDFNRNRLYYKRIGG